jgi:hypothetical protein
LAAGIHAHGALPPAAQNYHPNGAIGDIPDLWDANVHAYQLIDILKIVIFYNDDLGINVQDLISDRRRKVFEWLAEE